jgi:hypothetical protein
VRGHFAEEELIDLSRQRLDVARTGIVGPQRRKAQNDDNRDDVGSQNETRPPN